MGVFSWFRGKPAATAEASDQEAPVAAVATEPPAGAPSDSETGADDTFGEDTAATGVDIPKQQSVEEAADSEAGEGARK
ncbi:gliding motility protein [Streptomyces sp. NPDC015127]|uniref:gliding motility protein n=1 Tax=Streptomyces sp. NPDC015127 TaxID=3364939 RepID=UPI0036FC4CCD